MVTHQHIKACQDKHTPIEQLLLLAQLTLGWMSLPAAHYLTPHLFLFYLLPLAVVQLIIQNQTILHDLTAAICLAYALLGLHKVYEKNLSLTIEQISHLSLLLLQII